VDDNCPRARGSLGTAGGALGRCRLRSKRFRVLVSSRNQGVLTRPVGPSPGKPRVLSNRCLGATRSAADPDSGAGHESTHVETTRAPGRE
jgi:hypothetical protein